MSKIVAAALLAALSVLLSGSADNQRLSGYLSCDYYDPLSFARSVESAAAYPIEGTLRAGVVPHHLVAGSMIASFFETAAQSGTSYDTVIFAAPSHYPTNERAVTALSGWRTAFGTVENDRGVTERFIRNGSIGAKADESNMQLDHAISGLIPYVKYYLPQVKVSAVLMQNKLSWEHVEAFAQELIKIAAQKNILLVCSVDFSHYLMPDEAAEKDKRTRTAIAAFDYGAISNYGDEHMDSPQALTAFLKYAQGMGIRDIRFFDHSSSAEIQRLPLTDPVYRDGITTYFILGAAEDSTT